MCLGAQDGYTPLYVAALNGHLECMRLLLDRGEDKDAKTTVRALIPPLQRIALSCCAELCALARSQGTRRCSLLRRTDIWSACGCC